MYTTLLYESLQEWSVIGNHGLQKTFGGAQNEAYSSQIITHLMVLDLYSYSEFYKVKITRWLHVILSIQICKINLTEQKKKYI